MTFRISTQSVFARVLFGLRTNQFSLVRAQEQVASGLRVLRPSDDPSGAAKALSYTRQLADVSRFSGAIESGRNQLDAATSALQDGSTLIAEARALLLQAMNGTLTQEDRESLATEFDLLRAQLLDVGNLQSNERHVFGGTSTSTAPWQEVTFGGRQRVVYRGNQEQQIVRVGEGIDVALNLPGDRIFQPGGPSGTRFTDLTGVAAGTTADQGSGWTELVFRHDSTDPGALAGVGVALVGGGAGDTLLGPNDLVIDVAAGTVRLGSGPVRELPGASAADVADFVLVNERGGELHLDFSAFTGTDFSGTVTGNGSVSLDGTSFQALAFSETDLELADAAAGIVLHVDATAVRRAGSELVSFGGTVNVFDALQGIAADLRNPDGLEQSELLQRLDERLQQLDGAKQGVLLGIGVLGSRSQRLASSGARAESMDVELRGLRSDVLDTDYAQAALDLARAELTLQTAQASGARLIQTTLLNFLG